MYKEVMEQAFKTSLAYRSSFFSWIVVSSLKLISMWFVWTAIFNASNSAVLNGFTFESMMTYIAVSVIINSIIGSMLEFRIENDVKQGQIAIGMTKPFSYPVYCFFTEIGGKILSFLVITIPMILISIFFIKISMPQNILLFLISIILGFLINLSMVFLTGLWAFFSGGSIWGIRMSRIFIGEITSGSMIPLYFYPEAIKNVIQILPFSYVFHVPLSIYIGRFSFIESLNGISWQIIWLSVFTFILFIAWNRCKKKIFVYGG